MAKALRFHLVDESGAPLAEHIVSAVDGLTPRIEKEFSRSCDLAELCNCVEDAARSAARHEMRHGSLANTAKFLWTSISNRVISIMRSTTRIKAVPDNTLATSAGIANLGSERAIYARILGRECLAQLSERDQRICDLEYQGYKADQIARALGLTTQAVWKAQSRRRAVLRHKST